ncbi:hypothetical protein EDC04DRAFT_2680192 [Pisolithus marmoratus]|nr:hypothetical protein EDC04DRAFT_2680192 [Pisolithus marmoratus]
MGIVSAIFVLFNREVAQSVWLILLYLLGIAGLHITSSSLMSITLFVPNSADGSLQYQLTINVTPVSLGLCISILLLALSCYMIHGQPDDHSLQVSSCGVLDVIWLSSRHPAIQEKISEVTSESSVLREVGHRCTTKYGASLQVGDIVDGIVVGTQGIPAKKS